jgi:outer membrane protein OmpA-like peptidoglycan-associated protein
MKNGRSTILIGCLILAGLILGPACATKKMVVEQVAAIDQKVEDVETSVEENQKRIKQHDEQLATIGSLITQHDSQFKSVDGKIEEIRRATQGKLIYQETLRNTEAKFSFNSYELSPEIKGMLDTFIGKLISENKGVYLEIQGHTDSTGPAEVNLVIGQKRAEAVMEYLYKQHHVPLHRMQVISLGSSSPVGDNKTSEGRALNRRVEILVYE